MSNLRFTSLTLKVQSMLPIDLEGIVPERVCRLSEVEIAKMPVRQGNRTLEIGELFTVQIQPGNDNLDLCIQGDCSSVKSIGMDMKQGRIIALGNVGSHAGTRMTGGIISVTGNAGDWFAAEMMNGSAQVNGNCGSHAGGAYPGSRLGMRAGNICILGNAGDEVGSLMRRGFIEVRGNCGTFAGAAMIAGTIVVRGNLGKHAGAGMKRGTIFSMKSVLEIPPGFKLSCDYEPSYLNLVYRKLNEQMDPYDPNAIPFNVPIRCHRGDLLTGGRGEIWEVIR